MYQPPSSFVAFFNTCSKEIEEDKAALDGIISELKSKKKDFAKKHKTVVIKHIEELDDIIKEAQWKNIGTQEPIHADEAQLEGNW